MEENAGKLPEQLLFTINEVAKILNVHQQTLRNWEKKKVISPRRVGRSRIFMAKDIEICKKVKEYSGKGVSLRGIKELLSKLNREDVHA